MSLLRLLFSSIGTCLTIRPPYFLQYSWEFGLPCWKWHQAWMEFKWDLVDLKEEQQQHQISLPIASMIAVIVYHLVCYAAFASLMENAETLQPISSLLTPQLTTLIIVSCLNFVIIMILNGLYKKIVIRITDMVGF
ncbi:anoctamin-5-like isoform X2 [Macrotis lagotis]|uniref:anoctamin-5-like isoform X2 n=1 Tax=Macrotis lagotis TaxID=92651 RepID=UPI003D698822